MNYPRATLRDGSVSWQLHEILVIVTAQASLVDRLRLAIGRRGTYEVYRSYSPHFRSPAGLAKHDGPWVRVCPFKSNSIEYGTNQPLQVG